MKVFARKIMARVLLMKGYHSYSAFMLSEKFTDDFFDNKMNTLKEKLWAYKRGFVSSQIDNYGLTDSNCSRYLSDFAYHRMYPLNEGFDKWIDDKITTKYILYPFREYLPEYYYHINASGMIIPLMDAPDDGCAGAESIISLLEKKGILAFKLISGSIGAGFYKVSKEKDHFRINSTDFNKDEFMEFISGLRGYLITEYITSHHELSRIYSHSANTVRILAINNDGREPVLADSFIRFGTSKSGTVDNIYAGGLVAGVDMEEGRYYGAIAVVEHHPVISDVHPDTQARVEGTLPHWRPVKAKLIEISKYLSNMKYMGFDIAITEDGFRILEINSFPSIDYIQRYKPLLADNEAAPFFNRLINEKIGLK